jgi:1,4-dihydroxy-2-naphthoate octaprenyltransferase
MIKNLILAIRPKTLPAALVPVLMATAMAYGDGVFHASSAIVCIAIALLLQIATNLTNDYFDFKQGADVNRLGPIRVSQAGLLNPNMVLVFGIVLFLLSFVLSWPLYQRAGGVIILIAIISIVSGFFYTAGKKSLGYLGLGEIFVFIFFGPVAVAGTYYVQSLEMNPAVIIAGFGPGFLSSAILVVNNIRDIDSDKRAGKLTLAVRMGRAWALNEFLFLILSAFLTPFVVFLIIQDHQGIALASLSVFLAIPLIKRVLTTQNPELLNEALGQTARVLLVYGLLFSIGWICWSL